MELVQPWRCFFLGYFAHVCAFPHEACCHLLAHADTGKILNTSLNSSFKKIKQTPKYHIVKAMALTFAYREKGTCSAANVGVPCRRPVGSEFDKVSSPQPPECWVNSIKCLYPYTQLCACFLIYKVNMLGCMSHSIFLKLESLVFVQNPEV